MSAPQHTPGPWAAEYGADGFFLVTHDCGLELPDTPANEAMLGAAPALYDALEWINRIGSPRADRTLGECADDLQLIVDRARAALAATRTQ